MDFEMLNYVFAGMMVLATLVLLYGARVAWKVRNKQASVVYLILSILVGIGTYAIYGKTIMALFGK